MRQKRLSLFPESNGRIYAVIYTFFSAFCQANIVEIRHIGYMGKIYS